jgi:hypothetical protein
MQEYFYEDDASRVISILQACDPIVRRPFRLEVREGIVRHVLCTVLISGDQLTWSFEDIETRTSLETEIESLRTLPKEYGHEMNNFLTVIGSAAEGIHMDATDDLVKEDAEAILSMTERAAVLTRQFMHLGRKSLLPKSIVNVAEILKKDRARLERLINGTLDVEIQDSDPHVFASEYLLRNILLAASLALEGKSCTISVAVAQISHHFSHRVLGVPTGIYVVISMFESGFDWSLSTILNTRGIVKRESDELQGAWESLTRCRGGLCQHENAEGNTCISLFLPWVQSTNSM